MAQSGSNRKVANSLVVLSSAAVLAVYSAGYVRTQAAVDRFEAQAAQRRKAISLPPRGVSDFLRIPPTVPAHEPSLAASAPTRSNRDAIRKPSRIEPAGPDPFSSAQPVPVETPPSPVVSF